MTIGALAGASALVAAAATIIGAVTLGTGNGRIAIGGGS